MAIYRQLHTTFWKDKLVGEWNKDQKLFFLYLLSNDYTTQCGVYEINKRYAKFELDMTDQEIEAHIDFLISEGRIIFNEKSEEVMIVNWLKYNSARSPKVAAVIDKELKNIKTLEFELEVIKKCSEFGYPIKTKEPKKDTVSIGYRYSMDTILQPASSPATASSPTHNQHSNSNSEVKGATPAASETMFDAYQRFFGHLYSPIQAEDMQKWAEDITETVVVEAMYRASINMRDYGYAVGIMKNWAKKGVKSMDDVSADDKRFAMTNQTKFSNRPQQKQPDKLPEWIDKPVTETEMNEDEQAAFQQRIEKLKESR